MRRQLARQIFDVEAPELVDRNRATASLSQLGSGREEERVEA